MSLLLSTHIVCHVNLFNMAYPYYLHQKTSLMSASGMVPNHSIQSGQEHGLRRQGTLHWNGSTSTHSFVT